MEKIDDGNYSVLPSSMFFDLVLKLGEDFLSGELSGHLLKVELNESGSFDPFASVRLYVEKEVSLDSS